MAATHDTDPIHAAANSPVVLAVDGGGSKTDVVVIDLHGHIVSHARGEGTNPQTKTWPISLRTLDALRREALEGLDGRPIVSTHVYLAGLDSPQELAAAADALRHWSNADGTPAVIDNDLFALLRSGTMFENAAVVICGTGINALAVREDGQTARFAALGDISGDWGGGAYLGGRALWHAARADDGRGPATLLTTLVPETFGYPTVAAVVLAFHRGILSLNRLNELSPMLLAAAEYGDTVAHGVVDQQAHEIALMASVALGKLDLLAEPVPVVLGGGVLASGHAVLTDAVTAHLAQLAPSAQPVWVSSPPVLGAGLSALEAVRASPSAHARYTRHFRQSDVLTPRK